MDASRIVTLAHRDLGGEGKPPLVVLHGLLGSSRNWMAAGKDLSANFHVMALDLRNHGESGHAPEHNYPAMTNDVLAWLDEAGLARVRLMGHSMGGKTAMRLACLAPERVEALVVVDIAPRAKDPDHEAEFEAMNALRLEELSSRAEADRLMAERIPSFGMRQFLLTNLVRREDGSYAWQSNLPVLTRDLERIGEAAIEESDRYEGPALWIAGGKSDYVLEKDHAAIRRQFPNAEIEVFSGSGHNPHVEERERFVERVRRFLTQGGE